MNDAGTVGARIGTGSFGPRSDLAVIWVDAHPDIKGPAQHPNAHAHMLAQLVGDGEPDFVAAVPRRVPASRIRYVGLNNPNAYETEWIAKHKLAWLSPKDSRKNS